MKFPRTSRGRRPFNYIDCIARDINQDINDLPNLMADRVSWQSIVNSFSDASAWWSFLFSFGKLSANQGVRIWLTVTPLCKVFERCCMGCWVDVFTRCFQVWLKLFGGWPRYSLRRADAFFGFCFALREKGDASHCKARCTVTCRSCFWLWHFVLRDRGPLSVRTAVSPMELSGFCKLLNSNMAGQYCSRSSTYLCTAIFIFLWSSFLANNNSLNLVLGRPCGYEESDAEVPYLLCYDLHFLGI